MNVTLFVFGVLFLIMGTPLFFFTPSIVYGFYSYTGLDNISIYQNDKVISDIIGSTQLSGLLLLVSGAVFIPLSKYYYP